MSTRLDFFNDHCIGIGGFGKVYRGQLPLSTSTSRPMTTVAIKRLDIKGRQGQREFLMEIVMLASYKHDNLITLVGFSAESNEKIIVYEHEVRGSLDKHLTSTDLTWTQRLHICLGAARGLDYLHNGVSEGHRVLHRDIKCSNILLDENWEAKISDFGLSKISPSNQEFTFLVTNACGTLGYIDPLYMMTGVLTKESDVYSFGVVLFEVLCGRLAMNKRYDDERRFLSHLAKIRYEEEKLDEIIIPNLLKQMKPDSLRVFSRIAYRCLNDDRRNRPTMGVVVDELQNALKFQIGCWVEGLREPSTGGGPWSFLLNSNQKLRKIRIEHDDWIYSIAFTIEDFNGLLHSSPVYRGWGPTTEKFTEINFDADEEMTEILGTVGASTGTYAGYKVISSLGFVTKKGKYGPVGQETGTHFSVPLDIGLFTGFYGCCGYYLEALGCYLKGTTNEKEHMVWKANIV